MRFLFVLMAHRLDFTGCCSGHEACEPATALALLHKSPSMQEKDGGPALAIAGGAALSAGAISLSGGISVGKDLVHITFECGR